MLRRLATLLGLAAAAAALTGLIAGYLPITRHSLLIVASASPYLMLGAPIAAALLLGRGWILASLAAILTALLVTIQLPLYAGAEVVEPSMGVRVMTSNLGMGQTDPAALTATAQQSTDILVLQEMTGEAAEGLSAAGIDRTFPHRLRNARPAACGVGIWSRYPLSEVTAARGIRCRTCGRGCKCPGRPWRRRWSRSTSRRRGRNRSTGGGMTWRGTRRYCALRQRDPAR
ncbi:endonuclease/exonuclease/phosphatase family protein [Mycobacterium sp. GA-2829]|uniref:endonuclease/exonuclease/phosphatase family protein n=1 Tax=Mycobacterium sp. GA-2829 TaxID=1772283 RepID=UPI0007400324|nr:endonuclease/exonuclease/phosphatase family protein [Mycobacterium sp. GA-2829]KUI29201.1 hypothetical protein AU194_20180 [Mycobacterium sp. GA-2829]